MIASARHSFKSHIGCVGHVHQETTTRTPLLFENVCIMRNIMLRALNTWVSHSGQAEAWEGHWGSPFQRTATGSGTLYPVNSIRYQYQSVPSTFASETSNA